MIGEQTPAPGRENANQRQMGKPEGLQSNIAHRRAETAKQIAHRPARRLQRRGIGGVIAEVRKEHRRRQQQQQQTARLFHPAHDKLIGPDRQQGDPALPTGEIGHWFCPSWRSRQSARRIKAASVTAGGCTRATRI